MKNFKLIPILLFTFLIFMVAFSNAMADEQTNNFIEKLKWIELANPEDDAKSSIVRKDFRLRAIYGYSVEIPGVAQEDYDKVKKKFGINPIKGTSDSIVSSEHARLNQLASEYALKYNMVILNHKNK